MASSLPQCPSPASFPAIPSLAASRSATTWLVLAVAFAAALGGCVSTGQPVGGTREVGVVLPPEPEVAPTLPPEVTELPPTLPPVITSPPRQGPVTPPRPPSGPADTQPPLLNTFPRAIESSGVTVPVLGLVRQSREAARAKKYEQAEGLLERALRIEPRNAWVWRELAGLRLQSGAPEPAQQAARKSNSLAKRNPWIEVENYRVLAAAASALGDRYGASLAQARYQDRQRWITTPPLLPPSGR